MLGKLLGVRPPEESVPRWHISPAVDVLAYHFSWVFALIPLLLMGDRHPTDYLILFLLVLAGNFAHQALSLPLVYLDGEVFRRFRLRCTVFPLVMIAGFVLCVREFKWMMPPNWVTPIDVAAIVAAIVVLYQFWQVGKHGVVASLPVVGVASVVPFLPWIFPSHPWPGRWELLAGLALVSALIALQLPAGRTRWIAPAALGATAIWAVLDPTAARGFWPATRMPFFRVIGTVSAVAYIWNFWHVYMQKYGIFRVYNAKGARKVPHWVDRLLVFGWLPLTFVVLGTRPFERKFLLRNYASMNDYLRPLLDWLEAWKTWLWVPTIGLAAGSILLFLWYEWRAHRLRNVPRLSMLTGTTLLFAALVFFNPIKAVLAFGFSHVLEYFVFVWAYERRRYCRPLDHRPPLAYLLRHPAVAYPLFFILVGGAFFYFTNRGIHFAKGDRPARPFGLSIGQLLLLLGTFQAMTHFYFDGFLWKMRQPAVRKNI